MLVKIKTEHNGELFFVDRVALVIPRIYTESLRLINLKCDFKM